MNIITVEKNESGQIRPVSHNLTQKLDDENTYRKALLVLNSLEKFRAEVTEQVKESTKSKKSCNFKKIDFAKHAYQEFGEIGVNWFINAEKTELILSDRLKSMAICHACCIKHQSALNVEEFGMFEAYPLVDLSRDIGLWSEPTIRRFVQQNKVFIRYNGKLIDVEDMTPRSNRNLALYYIYKLGIDIGRTSNEQISEILWHNFGLKMGASNLRFLKRYI